MRLVTRLFKQAVLARPKVNPKLVADQRKYITNWNEYFTQAAPRFSAFLVVIYLLKCWEVNHTHKTIAQVRSKIKLYPNKPAVHFWHV